MPLAPAAKATTDEPRAVIVRMNFVKWGEVPRAIWRDNLFRAYAHLRPGGGMACAGDLKSRQPIPQHCAPKRNTAIIARVRRSIGAEVRLSQHRELRQALGPSLQRLDDVTIDWAVGETVRRLRGARRKSRRKARVAVDATGLAQGAVSTFFVRRMHHHKQEPLPWRHWLKWVVVADLDQQFLLSQIAPRPVERLCESARGGRSGLGTTRIGLVLADAEFDSERNHTYIRQQRRA